MFIGRYYHTLEDKGRLAIPKDYRSQLKSGAVLTRGLDGGLFLFPSSYWTKLASKLASLPLTNKAGRNLVRFLVQSSSKADIDSQGRTLIPEFLRETAKLKKHVVVAGALTRIEIWERETYHQHLDQIDKQLSDSPELETLGI